MTFLTVEDVNGVLYNHQNFWWHEIDTWLISEDKDFTNVKYDFCKISRKTENKNLKYKFSIKIDSTYWTKGFMVNTKEGNIPGIMYELIGNTFIINCKSPSLKIRLYMGLFTFNKVSHMNYYLKENTMDLNLKQLKSNQPIKYVYMETGIEDIIYKKVDIGYNLIEIFIGAIGYLFVNLLKSDFQFQCTQSLVLGKVNTVKIGALDDYKLNGDMIGTNVPNITILYDSMYIPARFDSILNDYVFDIDLTNKQTESKLRLKVFVESNDVLNASETDIVLNSNFETINNESKLKTLFKNGGLGRLGANIILSDDIVVDNDVLIIGNSKTINMNNHKIIVPSEKTFKSENTLFDNGKNTIQQQINSIVELNDCTFTNCTGLGSVIDCQLDIESLEVENDFITNITGCTFTNNDLCILHGGELNIENCTVTGKIGNPSYPYFLYQTDGNATILQSNFSLSSDSQISTDIEFNSCIFICGETATINGYDHSQLQNNNLTSFTTTQKNTSSINVTYYYPTISDYITLESSKGYCHSVSDIDFIFKSNVNVSRSG